MLVIHIDTMFDTALLAKVYEGIDNCTVLRNPRHKSELIEALKAEKDMVVFMGHGCQHGLFNYQSPTFFDTYAFDRTYLPYLDGKQVVGIWCDASDFAEQNHLSGFFTDMFISNEYEASMFGFSAANKDVLSEVDYFCRQVNSLLASGTPLPQWVGSLRQGAHLEKDYVRFNYDGLAYFD